MLVNGPTSFVRDRRTPKCAGHVTGELAIEGNRRINKKDGKIISPVAVIISDLMMGDEEDEMDDMETCLYEIYALAG